MLKPMGSLPFLNGEEEWKGRGVDGKHRAVEKDDWEDRREGKLRSVYKINGKNYLD